MSKRIAGRHERPRRIVAGALRPLRVAGLALIALAIAIVWVQVRGEPEAAHLAAAAGSTTPAASARARAITDAMDSCRVSHLRQESALSSAATSLALWRKHIEAMNLLVAGKITLSVAQGFWASSRVGAMQAVTAFNTADAAYVSGRGTACAPLEQDLARFAQPEQVQQLEACHTSLARSDRTLTLARAGVLTWAEHIQDMEALRLGQITPAQAVTMWQMSWRAGNAQLQRYDEAVATASQNCPLN